MTKIPQFLYGPSPQLSEVDQAKIRAWQVASDRMQVDERRLMIRFAAVLCRCDPRYSRQGDVEPQALCPIHNTLAWDPFTREWFW